MTASLPIRALHHVARLTNRLEASRAFYRDVLGFREIARPDLRFPGAWLENYGIQIHLITGSALAEPQGAIQTRVDHLAFLVDDMEAVERLLAEHGVERRVNIQADTGLKQIFFRDPDGHHVEVGSYPASGVIAAASPGERAIARREGT